MIGQSISHYKVTSLLGAGGMGEVYRATDTKLGRDVALKVLPAMVANDPERLARFQREAQVLASLNHTNIASIYGLEESGGVRALVMELVEGPTLAEKIKQGALPIDEVLQIAKQMAEAMEAAHEKGIIHRDLKPANVKITPGGKVKVLDFGLAKALASDSGAYDTSHSPTLTAAGATRDGLILGTAAYMSPEQARGKVLDKRTDIWAFGCVLLECLTGRQAFSGETVSDTIAAILTREPELDALPASTPRRIRALLGRCLQKDVKNRLHDIADARIEIEEALAHPEETPAAKSGIGAAPARGWRQLLPWGVAVVLGLALAVVGWKQFFSPAPTAQGLTRLTFEYPLKIAFGEEAWPLFVFSQDGTRMVFVGNENGEDQLYLRRMDQWDSRPIANTRSAAKPFLSPDGQWVAFSVGRAMKKVAIEGGPAVDLCEADWGGGSWGTDDQIIYTKSYNEGLWKISASGGAPQMVTSPDRAKGELGHWWPQVLPGGEWVLFTAFATPIEKSRIVVRSLKTGEQRTVLEGGVTARFASGQLVFARGDTVMAVSFDLKRMEVTGAPAPIVAGVATFPQNGSAQFAVSDTGTLAFIRSASLAVEQKLVSVDRSGKIQTIRENLQSFAGIRLSPDGRRLALAQREGGHAPDVWIQDLERGLLSRLTFGPASNFNPVWTADGKRLFYVSERPVFELYWKAVDGSSPEEAFLVSGNDKYPASVSPDGKMLLMSVSDPKTGSDLWLLPLEGKREPKPLLATPFQEPTGAFSPDGRWIAFQTNESGKAEIYVQDYPGGSNRVQISTEGGTEPVWSRNGKELFYRAGKKLMVVSMGTGAAPGKPRILFEADFKTGDRIPAYDVSPDGQHFYFIQTNKQTARRATLDIVLNWFDELRRRVPAGKD